MKFLAQFRHCDSFRKTFLSNGFIQAMISFLFYYILNGFEVCFCKLQTEYFSLRICDHFKAKLAVFSLVRGVGRNTERGKEVRFLPTMLRKIIISQGVLNITKEKQRPFLYVTTFLFLFSRYFFAFTLVIKNWFWRRWAVWRVTVSWGRRSDRCRSCVTQKKDKWKVHSF